jgi:hypothetical protein
VGPFAAKLTTEEEMIQHIAVTEAVHSVQVPIFGSTNTTETTTVAPKICLQILHTGRYAYHPFAVSASSTQSPISPFKARALSKAEIAQTVQDFTNTAVLAREAGYNGVEIMGSEGYLLSQFLSPATNLRTDDYGGSSFPNRSRLALEIVESVRQATGPDFIIIFRISLLDLVQGGTLWEETLELAAALEKAGVTILNTGIGWHEVRNSSQYERSFLESQSTKGMHGSHQWNGIYIESSSHLLGCVSRLSYCQHMIQTILPSSGSSTNDFNVGSQRGLYLLHQSTTGRQRGKHSPRLDQSY